MTTLLVRGLLLFSIGAGTVACGAGPRPKFPHTVAEEALEQYRVQQEALVSLRAEARVDQRGRDGRIRGTVLMFLELPDRVRFDAMTQFGPAAVLTSDGERFQLLDRREDRFLTGPTCPENIARLLAISLPAEALVRFLLGDTPQIVAERASIEAIRGGYRVELSAPNGIVQRLTFRLPPGHHERAPRDQELRLVESMVRTAGGAIVWRAEYQDHRPVTIEGRQIALPFVIRFEDPGRGRDVVVRFKRIDPNADVPAEAFAQRPPTGLPVDFVGCD